MTRLQVVRVGWVSWILAAVQVAAFDRFLLFGRSHLVLPLFLAVAVGSRIPLTNAVIAGAFIGGTLDLLTIDLFGRYALGLAVAGGITSLSLFGRTDQPRRTQVPRRLVANMLGIVGLVLISVLAGENLPAMSASTFAGVLLTAVVGTLLSGRVFSRLAMPSRTVWDPAPARSTDWADRRAGLYSVPAPTPEREAA